MNESHQNLGLALSEIRGINEKIGGFSEDTAKSIVLLGRKVEEEIQKAIH